MLLFFNIFLTANRNSGPNRVDRYELFKYCLASYAGMDIIDHVIFYCQLDTMYAHKESELREYVNTLFAGRKVEYYNFSPDNQTKWQTALNNSPALNDDVLTLYCGNDDHIFTDYELAGLYEGVELMKKEPKDKIQTLLFSSWPEAISTVKYSFPYERVSNLYLKTDGVCALAMQVVNSTFFKFLFFNLRIGNDFVRRTDTMNVMGWYPRLSGWRWPSDHYPEAVQFIPLREMGRHFDSYFHVGLSFNICPPLTLPPGFFERDIKINYCGSRKEGYYNMNPLQNYYLAGDPTGCDDKKMLDEIPYFWKDRITEIIDNSGAYTREELLIARNKAHRALITAPHNRSYEGTPFNGILPLSEELITAEFRK